MIAKTKSLSPACYGRGLRANSVVDRIFLMMSLHRERHALRNLDAHLLNDIGHTHASAKDEANRPVWDAPSRWLR